jgi:hypothetical protein
MNPQFAAMGVAAVLVVVMLYMQRCEGMTDWQREQEREREDAARSQERQLSATQIIRARMDARAAEGPRARQNKKDRPAPERDILVAHAVGASSAEAMMLDQLYIGDDYETPDDKYMRSVMAAGEEGMLPEGMTIPFDDFERCAMIRQDKKRQAIYGDVLKTPESADNISLANA